MRRFVLRLPLALFCFFLGMSLGYTAYLQRMNEGRPFWDVINDSVLNIHSYSVLHYVGLILVISLLIVLADGLKPGRMHPAALALFCGLSGAYYALIFSGDLFCCGHLGSIVDALGLSGPLDTAMSALPRPLAGVIFAAVFSVPLLLPVYLLILAKGAFGVLKTVAGKTSA